MTVPSELPDDLPAEEEGVMHVPVFFVASGTATGRRPTLWVLRRVPADLDWNHVFGWNADVVTLGEVVVPNPAYALGIEAAAWVQYGDCEGAFGRPVAAEFLEPDAFDALVGLVTVMLVTWPNLAPSGCAGRPPTCGLIARALRAHEGDVADALKPLNAMGADL